MWCGEIGHRFSGDLWAQIMKYGVELDEKSLLENNNCITQILNVCKCTRL